MKRPSQSEIDDVIQQCTDSEEAGVSKYPAMTFEQGVKYAIDWMQNAGPHPLDD